ncbi:MAG: hypothetical protein CVU93_03415 [Firmicutes bacterium HGW-Firmicutes-18]|nr:MAG: hypothetical protein CVU93_03415 [Firmicutes bacterium HGW-Firmicutes-18]
MRELKYTIENIMNFIEKNEIIEDDLPEHILRFGDKSIPNIRINPEHDEKEEDEIKPLNETIETIERDIIIRALLKSRGNKSKAAGLLKIPRQTLNNKIIKYNIQENYQAE